jgi:tetratricopeptide (TPR) repeat protein
LKRAAALKPQSSEAQAWLAYALMQDEDRLADARIAIERAIELAPGRIDYRLRWADIRILQGSYGDARKLLTSVSELRADPRSADAARRRLDRLDEYERAQQPVLRPLNPGERRAAGVLTRIECGPGIVRFRVRTSGVTILAVGTSLDAVDVRSHLRRPLRLECGLRENPDAVYVTWLPDATPSPERDGAIVALEFVAAADGRRQ